MRLITRRNFLFGLGGIASIGVAPINENIGKSQRIQSLANPQRDFTVSRTLSLKQRAANKGLIYGVASANSYLFSDTQYAATMVKNCSMLVPEWEFKWTAGNATLRPGFDKFDFTLADRMANFAKTNNLLLRGHALIWHESLPPWFEKAVNSKNAAQVLRHHIHTVVKRYAGKIHSWDVVNEVIEPQDRRPDHLRKTPWLKALGPNYIDLAFRIAAKADPRALLVYNEQGLDYDTPHDEARRNAVLKLLKKLKSQGTPIHALGIQAHLSPGKYKFTPEKFRKFLREVARLGLKILITEMDVTDKDLPLDVNVRDRIVAATYEDYLSVVVSEPSVIAVITWGLSDRYTWISEYAPRTDQSPVRTLPLDRDLKPKLAWNAIARAFDRAPKR
jgi:endo-1,4-beta-xylanase